MTITVEKIRDGLTEILKDLPETSVLAVDDLRGGRIPVASFRLKHSAKVEKPGMRTETTFIALSDTQQTDSFQQITAGKFLKILKSFPGDLEVALDDFDGKFIAIETIRAERPVQFEKAGVHVKIALVVLSENP